MGAIGKPEDMEPGQGAIRQCFDRLIEELSRLPKVSDNHIGRQERIRADSLDFVKPVNHIFDVIFAPHELQYRLRTGLNGDVKELNEPLIF